MSNDSSVSTWIASLKQGQPDAAEKLWQRYVNRLVALARTKLHGQVRRGADEHDIVQEAFDGFFRATKRGAITKLNDRDDLWQMLCLIVEHKLLDRVRFEKRKRRGGGKIRGDSFFAPQDSSAVPGMDGMPGLDEDPAFVAESIEQTTILLGLLEPGLRDLALLKLQGFTNEEIAEQQNCVTRTVERRLRMIRELWKARISSTS